VVDDDVDADVEAGVAAGVDLDSVVEAAAGVVEVGGVDDFSAPRLSVL
jgi:hypothetical protein